MTTTPHVTWKIARYVIRDILRSRWLIAYAIFFLALTDVLLRFGGTGSGSLLSLLSVILFVIPLVTIVFATLYLYHIREFTELVATQPVRRRDLFAGLHLGVAAPLTASFLGGFLVPFAYTGVESRAQWGLILSLAITGVMLTLIFVAMASLIAIRVNDRLKGMGAAIAAWLVFAVLYDGLVLLAATLFADYPLEPALLALMLANPIDIARVVLIMQFDVSALMGYTGAVFEKVLGGPAGFGLAAIALVLWSALPLYFAARGFARKDF